MSGKVRQFRVSNDLGSDRSPVWVEPQGFKATTDLVRKRAVRVQGEGFRQRTRDEEFGQLRELDEAFPLFRQRVQGGRLGDVHVLWALKNDLRILVREVAPTLALVDTQGNDNLDKVWTEFRARLGYVPETWGWCVRKNIAGTSTWSQHCPWPDGPGGPGCNAVDIHPSSMAEGDRMFRILAEMRGDGFPVGRTLWRVADHFDHLHQEGAPERTGTPRASCP